jgi:DNA-binding transcriptional regulator GbsR (MarR family)
VDWRLYAWIKRGNRRKEVLRLISKSNQPLTAKDIKIQLKISLSQVSFILKELQDKGIILCLNPEDKIGRLYKIKDEYKKMIGEMK